MTSTLAEIRDTIDLLYGSPLSVLGDCLRGFIIPADGHEFIAADLAAIESRKLNWLAGQEDVLKIYREDGRIYEHNAAGIYGVSLSAVTKEQRFIGKVAELSLGYQGGKRAFVKMAQNYGVTIAEEQAEQIKEAWRAAHPKVVRFWHTLEAAAIEAVKRPGEVFKAGHPERAIRYKRAGNFLYCRLPSGRCISYPYPKIVSKPTPWGVAQDGLEYMGADSLTKKWTKQSAYGGLLAENVTQASARDVLVHGMLLAESKGYPIVLHCHDEMVAEVPKGFGSVEEFEAIAAAVPAWAKGLPLAAKGWRDNRYRKD